MTTILLHSLLLIIVYASVWFMIALYKKRNDVADIAWGPGYILICGYLFITQDISSVGWLQMVLVAVWALRLSIHIYLRNRNKPEDYRYRQWREEWGASFYVRSFLQVFLLQGVLLLIIASPVMLAAHTSNTTLSGYSYAGVTIWLIGFYFQAVGDYQLMVFLKRRTSAQEIMQTGLWKYTRHPNYFGEIMMWWGIYIIVLPLPGSGWFVISPLLITYLLLYVSGIPLLEKKYRGNAAFDDYKKRTSPLVPLPPGKTASLENKD